MILDKATLFSDDQAITADAVSTNIVDLGVAARGISQGEPVKLLIQVTAAFNTLTTLIVSVQQDAVEALSSPEELATTTLVLADLVVGAKFFITFVPRNDERYLRLNYNVTGTDPTTGAITAGLLIDDQDSGQYFGAI